MARVVSGSAPAAGQPATLAAVSPASSALRVTVAALPSAVVQALTARRIEGVILQADARTPAQLIVAADGDRWVLRGADGDERGGVVAGDAAALGRALRNEALAYSLASLDNPGRPFTLDFAFGEPRNAFRLGEAVGFRIRSARGGYLTVVDVAPGGEVNVLYPNSYDRDNRVEPGQELTLPTPAMPFEFRVQEPLGRGVVRAFVTQRPLELTLDDGGDTVSALLAALRAAAGPPPVPGDALPVDTWATSYVIYDFTR